MLSHPYSRRSLISTVLLLFPALCQGQGYVTTVAGNGSRAYFGENVAATTAGLGGPQGVAIDAAGNLYFADNGSRIRKVDTSGIITTVAGSTTLTPNLGFGGDGGPATSAAMNGTGIFQGVAVDGQGNIFFADILNHRIRKVDSNGIINTVAGSGQVIGGGSTPTQLALFNPHGVAVDAAGNLYIADTSNSRIRRVAVDGTVTTVAGTGTAGYGGDGGPGASAQINSPRSVVVDQAGNVLFGDYGNHRIRKVDGSGTITTVAGNGTLGFSGDGGPATGAQINTALGLAVDSAGNLYIADTGNDRIRKVDGSGTITTIAGNGAPVAGFQDGGLATATRLFSPRGLALDAAGNLYFSDYGFNRIRKISPTPPAVSVLGSQTALSFVGTAGGTSPVRQTLSLTSSGAALTITPSTATTTGGPWLTATTSSGTTPATLTVNVSTAGLSAGVYDGTVTVTPAGAQNIPLVVFVTLTVNPATPLANTPTVAAGGVVNGASFAAFSPVSPGSLVTIFGSNMSTSTASAASLPLATTMGGAQVLMNGRPAPLVFVSPGQINAQVPWELDGNKSINVRVVRGGVASNTVVTTFASGGPGVFRVGATTAGIITHGVDGSLVTPQNPATRGEVLVVYATGLGPVTNRPESGAASPGGPLATTTTLTTVTIGSQPATVYFAGLSPGFVGLCQINLQVPANAPLGDEVEMLVLVGGGISNTVTLAVR